MRHKGHGSINNLDEHSKGMERETRARSIQTASHGTRSQEHRNTRQGKGCREEGDPTKRGYPWVIVLLSQVHTKQ